MYKITLLKCIIIILLSNSFTLLLIYNLLYKNINIKENRNTNIKIGLNNISLSFNQELDYEHNKFIIIKCQFCKRCGLFALFKYYVYGIADYINKGYIPLIDLASSPNLFNGYKPTLYKNNPYEFFFEQPFGYTLENVIKKAKNIEYSKCTILKHVDHDTFYSHKFFINYWHNIAKNYLSIKKEIINESDLLRRKLFYNSDNVLGILMRWTDYLATKPKNHPIPPDIDTVFKDVIEMETQNKYDYYFIATEDDLIRNKFIKKFEKKLKYIE